MIARRKHTEILLDELLKLQPEPRNKVIRAPRFQRADLLDLILDKSEKTAAGDPPEAVRLAALAVELGIATRSTVEDPPGGNRLVKAILLLGSTHRLGGDRDMAERAFGSAAYLLTRGSTPLERARVCRGIALLRWEQGRLDEAAAMLLHGARLYEESGEIREEGACLALLGILHTQEDEPERGLEPLLRARSIPGGQPQWLAARTLLALALCLAEEDRVEEARQARDEGVLVGRGISDPGEEARLQWLEGRLSARIGPEESAEGLLVTAATRLVTLGRLPEATLAALDLAVLYAETGQSVRVIGLPRMMSDVRSRPGLDVTVQAIRDLLGVLRKGAPPRQAAALVGAGARQVFRLQGLPVDALPWL